MTEILITGATGQLGSELRNLLDERNVAYDAFDSHGLDITDEETVMKKVEELQPKVIYHCAAYTAVDNAEDQYKAANWQVNETGTQNIAQAAKKVGALLVYVSTDYVFDGTNPGEYKEDDPTNPKNEYGKAKLAGEEIVKQTLDNYYIVRTSWVFGKYGRNFVYTMLRLAKDHDRLTVVNDQFGRPTWTRTLAEFITHLSNDDSCSWYEFAKEILADKDVEVAPVTSKEYPQKAYRPRHSIMSLEKAKATGYEIPTWQEALKEFMSDIEDGQEN